jgi:acyl-CoA ligase (AMP-forming) (exosortase A-associated)
MLRCLLHHLIAESACARGDAIALTFKDTSLTYRELWSESRRVGAGLKALGLRRGERVAIYLDKRIETVAAVFGTSVADGVFVPVNPVLRPKQVSYILENCSVRVLITSPERHESLRDELRSCPSLHRVIVAGEEAAGPGDAAYQVTSWSSMLAEPVDTPKQGGAIDMDVAAIFYTSGSTGKPKGVVLSHRNLIAGAESVSHYLENVADDIILSVLPLSFDAGFSQLTTAFTVGARVVLVNYLLPEEVVRLCSRYKITGLTGVPPLWIQLAEKSWSREATANLRYFANTGGRMPKATLDRLRSIFPGAKPYLMYGLTEAFRSTYLDPSEVDRRPDSIGKAIPNAEILVVRPDGTLCGPGEQGELVHRGALVGMGYWKDPEKTAERYKPAPGREEGLCIPEMAVWSGDLVVRDEEGFLYFVGRNDEMIKTSGYRVSPTEIEEVAYDTGLVRDAVALGIDDPRIGQHVVLIASPSGSRDVQPAELLAELKKRLPLYMVPKEVILRDTLPRSPNGKFDRNLLRQELTSDQEKTNAGSTQ